MVQRNECGQIKINKKKGPQSSFKLHLILDLRQRLNGLSQGIEGEGGHELIDLFFCFVFEQKYRSILSGSSIQLLQKSYLLPLGY
jgi:hypothetical protein